MKNKKTKDNISSTINAKLVFIKDKEKDIDYICSIRKNKKMKTVSTCHIETGNVDGEKTAITEEYNEDNEELFKRPRELVMFKDGIAKVTSKETIEKMDEMMNAMTPKNKEIHWVCHTCGQKALEKKCNKDKRQLTSSTWHVGICDVCGEEGAVTEHRDFGYCEF